MRVTKSTKQKCSLQQTGVVKSAVLGGWTPYHLKSAHGRSRHHLKWPFYFLLFMGLVGHLHPINPFIWPHLRLYFWHLIVLREEKRREIRREEYSQRQLGSRLGCVQRRLGGNKQCPPPFGRVLLTSSFFSTPTQAAWNGPRRIRGRFIALLRRPAALQQGEI